MPETKEKPNEKLTTAKEVKEIVKEIDDIIKGMREKDLSEHKTYIIKEGKRKYEITVASTVHIQTSDIARSQQSLHTKSYSIKINQYKVGHVWDSAINTLLVQKFEMRDGEIVLVADLMKGEVESALDFSLNGDKAQRVLQYEGDMKTGVFSNSKPHLKQNGPDPVGDMAVMRIKQHLGAFGRALYKEEYDKKKK